MEKIKELEGLKALVVDDDFNTCDSVTKMLVQVGMRSEWTLSGREAVLRSKQALELGDEFHAYIIDWRLPDMYGIEVTRQIRSLGDNTPIIILTAQRLPVSLAERFIGKFLQDKSFGDLSESMKIGDRKAAFLAVHTLKGVCANLGFTALFQSASYLCEELRDEEQEITAAAYALMKDVERDYAVTVSTIKEYLNV